MKLYYLPGACSLASHIVAREAGLKLDIVKVERSAGQKTAEGRDYTTINPKGAVPALVLDNGDVLTENAVVLQYLAEQAPKAGFMPSGGGMQRWRLLELLHFVATELHKNFSPLFNPATPPEMRKIIIETLGARFDVLERTIGDKPYLTGENFTIADAYAYTVLNWSRIQKIDLDRWSNLKAFVQRVAARPAVQQALREEGLLK